MNAQFNPGQINWQMLQQMGQNIGQGMQGGQGQMEQDRRMQMMQGAMGPQSQAGWQMGTTLNGRPAMMGRIPGR
jgi:hypothetical protein